MSVDWRHSDKACVYRITKRLVPQAQTDVDDADQWSVLFPNAGLLFVSGMEIIKHNFQLFYVRYIGC